MLWCGSATVPSSCTTVTFNPTSSNTRILVGQASVPETSAGMRSLSLWDKLGNPCNEWWFMKHIPRFNWMSWASALRGSFPSEMNQLFFKRFLHSSHFNLNLRSPNFIETTSSKSWCLRHFSHTKHWTFHPQKLQIEPDLWHSWTQ